MTPPPAARLPDADDGERLREAFDWSPQYPTVDEVVEQVVDRWLETDTVRDTEAGREWTGA